MPIRYQEWITREEVRANPRTLYVFGDNLAGTGYGGQAKEMRGEYNVIGIPTKDSPAFYASDSKALEYLNVWVARFNQIYCWLDAGGDVVWPADGIGTGLADMSNRAPILWSMLECLCKNLFEKYGENKATKE